MSERPDDAPAPAARAGLGCWAAGLATMVCAAVLVIAGLFLPPVNLYERLTAQVIPPLAAQGGTVSTDGLTLTLTDAGADPAFGVAVVRGEGGAPDVPNHRALGPVYQFTTTGAAPDELSLSLALPEGAAAIMFDVYGWSAGGAPVMLPAQPDADGGQLIAQVAALPEAVALYAAAPPAVPMLLLTVDVTQTLRPEDAAAANYVAPAGLQPALDGSLVGSLAAGFDLNRDYRVLPVIRNFADPRATDPETISAIIRDPALLRAHAGQLASFASAGYDGVILDYRDLPESDRDAFTRLVAATADLLHGTGLLLGVTAPMPTSTGDGFSSGAVDLAAIGRSADLVQVLMDPSVFLLPIDDPAGLDARIAWMMRQTPREKLLLTLPTLSQREAGGALTPIGYEQALSALGDVVVESAAPDAGSLVQPGEAFRARLDGYSVLQGTDTASEMPFLDYSDAGTGARVSRVWLMTPAAFNAQIRRVMHFAPAGIAVNDLLASGAAPGLRELLAQVRQGTAPVEREDVFGVRWTIARAEGAAQEVVMGLGEPLIATVSAPEGNYAVNAAVVSSSAGEVQRAGAAVSVFLPSPTFTPSPTPTATPTPLPTPTPAPVVVVSVSQPQVVAAGAPAAGSIVSGQFEYGGHVTSTQTNQAEQMRRAGMNWMKVQVRYFPGMDAGEAGRLVSEAHGRGFKLLLGVVGSPADLAAGGAGYMQQFASFLGGLAGYGPDAIEVWNEPNLDREWPEGQISGEYYAQMLQMAYNAIKSANSGVMVISGAPAPTGAEAAYPGRVLNDDNWIRGLVAAGGLQWMDCLGAHYNEGIVGPGQRSGDPRDNYYTRYFGGMLDTYWGLVNGQRPICITELGYLTPEGFPPLPSYFAWAQNVTLAQQAAWLAEAAALSSQSGRVRLMIVWNIDFDLYGTDPQAGYAIVRPGGGCPACDALAAAR